MNLLAFDTSTEVLSVAAERRSGSDLKKVESAHQGIIEHAERILPMIEKTLSGVAMRLNEVDVFLIGEGPGSFTGLRVGFGTLQGFAASSGKPCYSIPSLDITAQGAVSHQGTVSVLMDARRDKVYLALYESKGGKINQKDNYLCISPEEAVEKLRTVKNKLFITGDGLKKYGELFRKSLKDPLFASEEFWYPHASKLIELFHERKDSIKPKSAYELLPLYLQEPHIGPAKKKVYDR